MSIRAFILGILAAVLLLLIPVSSRRPSPEEVDGLRRTPVELCAGPSDSGCISPYDALIKHAADSIGWDWRLLSAVVYHESRFHNGAESAKGARGLMQVRSQRYTPEELFNPARNITVGSRYLHKLEKRYAEAGPVEAIKLALAAYNLGEGRVEALMNQADDMGLDAHRWDSVATLLPKGHHTVSYVDKIWGTYARYARQYPR